jgi:hypothetical protein
MAKPSWLITTGLAWLPVVLAAAGSCAALLVRRHVRPAPIIAGTTASILAAAAALTIAFA